jgi:tetratricopeptide (TPR) repeat protein
LEVLLMRIIRLLSLVFLGSTLLTSCMKRIPEVSPADIPRIQNALQASPESPELLTQLGMAQYKARNYADAAEALTRAIETGEASGAAYLYLGLTREDQEEWGEAREAYTSYVDEGRYGPLKDEIQRRLGHIAREELRARAQSALAMEDELSTRDPVRGSVAVFPFHLTTGDEELMPLQVALADMMTTDLSLSGGVTVLERTQVQSLLAEMSLTEAGFTSPETGARAGRLLRAEHVVQGALTILPEEALRFDTDVLNTVRRASAGEASAQSPLEDLFDMEKETVFRILGILRVEITSAEREAINQNRAENILAFLSYGRGLMAIDDGNFSDAEQFFGQAVELDPGFGAAQDAQVEADDLQEAGSNSTESVSSQAGSELGTSAVQSPTTDPGVATIGSSTSGSSILQLITEGVVPSPTGAIMNLGSTSTGTEGQAQNRDPTQEATNREGLSPPAIGSITLTITLPGGGD